MVSLFLTQLPVLCFGRYNQHKGVRRPDRRMDSQMFEQFSKQQIILMKEFVTTLFNTLNADVKEVRKENEELKKSLDV